MNIYENAVFSSLESEKYEIRLENGEFTVIDKETGAILTSDALDIWKLRQVIDKCISLVEHNNNVEAKKLINEDFLREMEDEVI